MIYRFGDYERDAERCELRCAGQQVAAGPKVFEVLIYLVQHCDRMVSKEELLEQCWPGTFVSDAALTRCLSKVRKIVQPDPSAAPVIKTVYGRGYCFVAPVSSVPRVPSGSSPAVAHNPTLMTVSKRSKTISPRLSVSSRHLTHRRRSQGLQALRLYGVD